MEGLFSKRFKKALDDKTIPYPKFKRNLRRRIAMLCNEVNEELGCFNEYTNTEIEAFTALKRAYGAGELRVLNESTNDDREANNFEDFIVFSYPHQVIDAIEGFYRILASNDNKSFFQVKLNAILAEEESPWRMSDGAMYMVDSRFLDALKDQVDEEMSLEGFLGAREEFKDARSNLMSGDIDDAIHKANCAFESALKSLLNQKEGAADDLLKMLRNKTDLLGDVPDETQSAMTSKVLHALPVLRHKIGGHGQGAIPVDVPYSYGDLAINLAATYIKFLLDLKKELTPTSDTEECLDAENDDVPF